MVVDSATLFSTENLENAGDIAKMKMLELRASVKTGDWSLRLLALLGGVALIFTAVLELVSNILNLNVLGALIEIYVIFLGIIVLVLEGSQISLPPKFLHTLHKYALFLKYIWGRGLLYFVAGSLLVTGMQWMDYIVGGFMCLVGVLYVCVGRSTTNKLKEMRQSELSERTLRQSFTEVDPEGTGLIGLDQFRALTNSIGLDMNRRQSEAAFLHIEKVDNDQITFEELYTWFISWDDSDAISRAGNQMGPDFV
ncbi:COPI associated protein [Seminavis robusta]|uniref:COPI associated protein n=1 Tax=Seminavis robusta TaxID=568900 RepID=A0A9N8HZ55_9STRA|nr:COPI associated protein [Seminavis robusta]|eukprot:Sro2174_g317710.1 COPI associated protein (253) ;mRNA; r:13575-14422